MIIVVGNIYDIYIYKRNVCEVVEMCSNVCGVVEPSVTGVRVAGLGAYESSDDSGDEREDTSDQQLQVRTEAV